MKAFVTEYKTRIFFQLLGSMLIKKVNGQEKYEYKRQSSVMNGKTLRAVWFFFPGLGGQWPAMAKALMPIDIFANKIEECAQILKPYKIDLKHMLLSDDKNSMSTMTNKFIATTSMQIALVEVLHELDITPDGIIGHSFGEIACAYADGCLTTEEAVLASFWRGVITESDSKIPKGLMAAVGLSYNEARKMLPKGVDVVCDNSKDSVTISGNYMKAFHIFLETK
jgi:fatty acid synthase